MLVVDYLIIAVVLISAVLGFFRGFFREAWSLLSWVVAIWAAWRFSGIIEPYIGEAISSEVLRVWLGGIIVFAVVLVLGGLLSGLVGMLFARAGSSGTDRMLGMVFGVGRGVLIVGVLALVGEFLQMPKEPWWGKSALVPYGQRAGSIVKYLAGIGMEYLDTGEISLPAEATGESKSSEK